MSRTGAFVEKRDRLLGVVRVCLLVAAKPAVCLVVQQSCGVAVCTEPSEEPVVNGWPLPEKTNGDAV